MFALFVVMYVNLIYTDMNKYFICLDADEDSGKSATLLCLIRMLEAQNFDKLEAFPHN